MGNKENQQQPKNNQVIGDGTTVSTTTNDQVLDIYSSLSSRDYVTSEAEKYSRRELPKPANHFFLPSLQLHG
ncbi:hypothetical protein D5086_026833 [Populus alba]|uniref:Uncharacterized protein n=1 Tax=Populus alba TaxID=43335 RepID=A0ACC4B3D8_POPAL